jgi:hypothetical protein
MLKAQQVSHSGTFSEEAFETFRKQIVVYEKLKRFADAVEDVIKMNEEKCRRPMQK